MFKKKQIITEEALCAGYKNKYLPGQTVYHLSGIDIKKKKVAAVGVEDGQLRYCLYKIGYSYCLHEFEHDIFATKEEAIAELQRRVKNVTGEV